jgi:hypothetical protein
VDQLAMESGADEGFEAEVTALRTYGAGTARAGHALFGARLPVRQRIRRAASATLVVVVVLSAVLMGIPGGASAAVQGLLAAHSIGVEQVSRAGQAGTLAFVCHGCYYITADIPWVHVTLDGKPLRLPRVGADLPLVLASGWHTLVWQADPFPPETCRLSGSSGIGALCRVYARPFMVGQWAMQVAIVWLQESLYTVPPSLRAAAAAVLRQAAHLRTQQAHASDK